MPAPTVFISYSHKDEDWKDRLVTHLGVLEEEGLLQTWNDRKIGAGDEWFEEIRKGMDTARVAVLLISANSLTSKFIRNQEVPRLLERRSQEGVVIFPVIVKDCAWQKVPWLAKLQVRPLDGKPLALRGIRIDSELTKIAEEILGILDGTRTPEPIVTPPIVTALSSLHQLPSPPADFTGREEDLQALRSALAQGGTGAIFGLRGAGGIGKTVLALKLTEELKPLYPDAQLYLDLKGVDPQPLTTAQAMAHVIRSYHPEARLPEGEADLAGLYRSVLDDKRTLLLMDNAASREQVEPLIPPSGSLLLVTSRFHFHLPGLVSRDLDELPLEDARNLLLKIASRIGKEANTLAQLCGRLPLALRLAGSVLAERPDLSIADYTRLVEEGKARFDKVEAALTVSYELLNENRRRLWRLLAVFPDTFDAQAAAAVWELEIDSVSEALGDLVRSSLVEWEERDERYRLHDLARSFADRQLAETEREAARRQHAEYFLELLRAAKGLYKQGDNSLGRGLRLFDAEWGNIQAGFAWASGRAQEDETAARICDDYPDAGTYLLDLRQHPREQIRWREFALAAARQRKDRDSEAAHLGNLGLAYAALGELRRAIEHHEQCLTITRDIGDLRGEGGTLGNLGLAYADLGEPRRAIEHHEQCLAIARDIGDRRGEGNALGNLGTAYADLGEPRRAIEYYEQRLAIAREIGDRRGEGNALGSLGIAYADLGEPRRAIEHYEQRLAIAREIGDRRGEGNALGSLGIAYADLGEPRRAIEHYEQRLAIAREIGDRLGEGNALGNLGIAYKNLGALRRAIEYYEQQLAITREMGDRRREAIASWNLGLAIEKEGDLARAADLMQVCVDYEREIGHPDAEKDAARVAALRARIAEQGS